MDIFKRHIRFAAAVIQGENTELQDKGSDISLSVPEGIEEIIAQGVHTDIRPFLTSIPEWECFISPVVEVHCHQSSRTQVESNTMYCLQIPHVLDTSFQQIKVRCGDLNTHQPFEEIPVRGINQDQTGMFYEADTKYIRVYSTHFCQIICTSCRQTCSSFILALPFGSLHQVEHKTLAKVKVYLCNALYKIEDFRTVCYHSYFNVTF